MSGTDPVAGMLPRLRPAHFTGSASSSVILTPLPTLAGRLNTHQPDMTRTALPPSRLSQTPPGAGRASRGAVHERGRAGRLWKAEAARRLQRDARRRVPDVPSMPELGYPDIIRRRLGGAARQASGWWPRPDLRIGRRSATSAI